MFFNLFLMFVSEIEGINSIGKSVSVSFRVRVVPARMGRVLPTLVARSQTFSPGRLHAERAFCAGTRVLSVLVKSVLYAMVLCSVTVLAAQVQGFSGNAIAKP